MLVDIKKGSTFASAKLSKNVLCRLGPVVQFG